VPVRQDGQERRRGDVPVFQAWRTQTVAFLFTDPREVKMEKPVQTPSRKELYCLAILIGECAGVVYVLGTTLMRVLNLW